MEVSIIIPVYNVAPYIEDCLKSVMRQTFPGQMECLIVDDCGTDASIPITERLIAEYDGPIRFEILHHEHNRGLSAARNTGAIKANGDYLFFLDSDDEITVDCISSMMAIISEDSRIEMVQGNAMVYPLNDDAHPILSKISLPLVVTNDDARQCYYLYGQLYVNVWNKLFQKSFILNNNLFCQDGLLYEDNLFTFYLVKHLSRAYFMPEITYLQKKRPHSITTGTDKVTRGRHYRILYGEILKHLTPGYEREEYKYFARLVGDMYFYTFHNVPLFKDVFLSYKSKCGVWGNMSIRIRLTLYSILRRFKYGRLIWSALLRFRHPTQIPRDFVRIWHWTQRHYRPLFAFHGR